MAAHKRGDREYYNANIKIQYLDNRVDIHPYILGAFLGNGCKTTNGLLELSSGNITIPKKIARLLSEQLNQTIVTKKNKLNYSYHFYFVYCLKCQ